MQTYSDPTRSNEPHSLPDVEVFYIGPGGTPAVNFTDWDNPEDSAPENGWYWWNCFPGCLPDSEPMGPFATEAEAIADAQDF